MTENEYSVVLRHPDRAGISYWCFKIPADGGRPDIAPERPWHEMREGDRAVAADGTVYEVDRVAASEDGSEDGPLPECREMIDRLLGRSPLTARAR